MDITNNSLHNDLSYPEDDDEELPPLISDEQYITYNEMIDSGKMSWYYNIFDKLMENDKVKKTVDKYKDNIELLKNKGHSDPEIKEIAEMFKDAIIGAKNTNNMANEASSWIKSLNLMKETKKEVISLPETIKQKKEYASILTTDIIKKERIFLTELTNKSNITGISPCYKYTNDLSDLLVLQTSFQEINNYPFHEKSLISLNVFDNDTLEFFNYYIKEVTKYIEKKYDHTYNKISHDSKFKYKIYTDDSLGSYCGKLFSYNASKKYLPIESYNITENLVDKKVFYCKKEIRLLLSPMVWLDPKTKKYGFAIKIYTIEVKYPNMKITSVFDNKQINVSDEITHIQI